MKVLEIINSLEIGGAENILFHITPELIRNGVETQIFVFFREKNDLVEKLEEKNVKIIIAHGSSLFQKTYFLYNYLTENTFDVVHTHLGISNYLGRIAAIFAGVPKIILHEHGSILKRSITKRLISRILHIFTLKICYISNHDLHYFSKLDFISNSSKNVLLPNPSLYPIKKARINDKVENIGMVGRLEYFKGHKYALHALAEVKSIGKEFNCLLVGNGKKDVEVELLNIAQKNNLNFHILKGMHNLTDIYKSFDLFIHPSISEGFGMTIIEAMSFGIPVVASNVGGIPDIIVHGYNGLLAEPGDSQSLCENILQLIESKELREYLSKNGRETVKKKYSLNNYVDRLISLYEA